MRTCRGVLLLGLVLSVAVMGWAEEKPKRKGPKAKPGVRAHGAPIMSWLKDIDLSEEQEAKLKEIIKEAGPKLVEVRKKMADVLTDAQKTARQEAIKAAREAGKKGKEMREAMEAAVELTDEQKEAMKEIRKEMQEAMKTVQEQVMALLTPEQREAVKEKMRKPAGKRKPKPEAKKAEE